MRCGVRGVRFRRLLSGCNKISLRVRFCQVCSSLQDASSSSSSSTFMIPTCQVKNARLAFAVIVCFAACVFFAFYLFQISGSGWRYVPSTDFLSRHFKAAMSFMSSADTMLPANSQAEGETERTTGGLFEVKSVIGRGTSSGEGIEEDFQDSSSFQTMVRAKRGNFSNVASYLESVEKYLRIFRSPMIRETPSVYSWPEWEKEKRQRTATLRQSRHTTSTTKLIVWYKAPDYLKSQTNEQLFGHCPVKNCMESHNYAADHAKADAVLFYRCPNVAIPSRDHADQIFVFFNMESPPQTSDLSGMSRWRSFFNWTWNYRTDSDIFEPVGYLKRSDSVPSHSRLVQITRQKTGPISWMSSNCNVQSQRDQYVRRLRKIVPVDHYGRCGQLRCEFNNPNCTKLLNRYFFYLSFENSMCLDYVTEKYYKTFNEDVHVVPVVRGGANYSRFFPEGTFIDAESFSSPEELGQYLQNLMQDEARYVDLLWRKAHFLYHEHGIVDAYCQICYKVNHVDRFSRTYSDMYLWHNKDRCRPPRSF